MRIKPITILYLLGLIITSTELILKYTGRSLCQSQGCRIVESYVKAGEQSLIILGIILFSILLFVSLKDKIFYKRVESSLLTVALGVEGYLLGFQTFVVKEFCSFCLTIFVLIFFASIYRFLRGRKELVFGFLSLVSVFFITYFVNNSNTELPQSQYVLIYSKECPHCKEVIKFCQENSIPVQSVEFSEIKGVLRELKIESVPVLYCNEGNEKKFIVGSDNIKQYLVLKRIQKIEEGSCPLEMPIRCN